MKMKKAFTIIELLIVMAVIAILVSIAIPSFRAMQNEAWKAKAQGDVRVLKIAMEAYYKNHGAFPAAAAYQTDLRNESASVLESNLYDPFGATATTQYICVLSTSKKYYAVYSIGPGTTVGALTIADDGTVATTAGTPIYATNGR